MLVLLKLLLAHLYTMRAYLSLHIFGNHKQSIMADTIVCGDDEDLRCICHGCACVTECCLEIVRAVTSRYSFQFPDNDVLLYIFKTYIY